MNTVTLQQRITPKRLILSLLSSTGLKEIEVFNLIEWGKIFGIEAAATRVAVGRLLRQNLIATVSRGKYSIGPQGALIAKTASDWANVEQRIGQWQGDWIAVHISHLGRTNKTALRARERAFRLNGFSEFVTGLWCRPGNFKEPLSQTRQKLIDLGLEPQAVVMNSDGFPGFDEKALYNLWPVSQLESNYQRLLELMDKSQNGLTKLNQQLAARETFLVGETVIKQINADPLLPDKMINSALRHRVIAKMIEYNQVGRKVWEQFHADLIL